MVFHAYIYAIKAYITENTEEVRISTFSQIVKQPLRCLITSR